MIRTIRVEEITKNIKEMCIEANHFLSLDMAEAMKCAEKNEEAPLGTVAREFEDCRRGYDSDLSGYRNGSSVS